MKHTGISREGMEPEWIAKEGEKSNKLIRARILEASGEVDAALTLYAEAAEMEEQLAAYCRSLGLIEKSWIKAISAAGCWEAAGDLHRALQGYQTLLADPTLTPQMRKQVCELAEALREQRRQWSVFRQQHQISEGHKGAESVLIGKIAAA